MHELPVWASLPAPSRQKPKAPLSLSFDKDLSMTSVRKKRKLLVFTEPVNLHLVKEAKWLSLEEPSRP